MWSYTLWELLLGSLADLFSQLWLHQITGMPMFELPGMPGASVGAISVGDIFGKAMGQRTKKRRTTVQEAYEPLIAEESDALLDQDQIVLPSSAS